MRKSSPRCNPKRAMRLESSSQANKKEAAQTLLFTAMSALLFASHPLVI